MKKWLPRLLATLAALVPMVFLFLLLKYFQRWDLSDNALDVGTPVAAFSLPDTQGRHLKLPPPGREVLINYWASWCKPCLAEMPLLRDFAQRNGGKGTQVVGIALEDAATSRPWLGAHPSAYPMLLEPPGKQDSSVSLGNALGLLPFSVLVGADGRVLATRTGGFTDAEDLEDWVADAH